MAKSKVAGRKRRKSPTKVPPSPTSSSSTSLVVVSEDIIRTVNKRILRNALKEMETEEADSGEKPEEASFVAETQGTMEGLTVPALEEGKEPASPDFGKSKGEALEEPNRKPSIREALVRNRANINGKRLNFVEGFEDGVIRFTKKDVEKAARNGNCAFWEW